MSALTYKYEDSGDDYPMWEAFHFKSMDNPFLNEKELERMMKSDDRPMEVVRQEIEASFISGGGKVLKPDWFEVVDSLPSASHRTEGGNHVVSHMGGSIYVTVDLAGFIKGGGNKVLRTDESVIATTFVTPEAWYILDSKHGHWDVRETALNIVRTATQTAGCRLGIESGALMNAVGPYIEEYMREFGRYVTIEPLKHGNSRKIDRIQWALQGRAERRKVKLIKGDWNQWFLDQVSDFPDPLAHDDGLDAVAYVDQMAKVNYIEDLDIEEWEPMDIDSGY